MVDRIDQRYYNQWILIQQFGLTHRGLFFFSPFINGFPSPVVPDKQYSAI
jgi:hypothetical protein